MKHKSLFKLFFVSILGLGAFGVIHAANKEISPVIDTEAADDYYASIDDSLTGKELLTALRTLNNTKKKKSVSYGNFRYFAAKSDINPQGGGKIVGFYNNAPIGPNWDSGNTWNREHMWPKSRKGSNVENDAHMVRPTATSINSERGNKFFGTESDTYDPGQYFAEYRGISARIIFYCVVADTALSLVDKTDDSESNGTMGKLSTLLKWNLEYAPSTSSTASLALKTEQNRNDVIQNDSDGQGNRNPFIDHPEYACRIWGNTNDATKAICGSQPQPASLSISKTSISLTKGGTTTISATSSDSSSITWTSSNASVVTIPSSSSSGSNVTVTAVGAGTATLTAKATISGQVLEKTCSVTVSEVPPVTPSITLNPTRITMSVGDKATLTATVKDGSGDVTWKIEGDVASISGTTGTSIEVTGLKEGQTYITATYSGVSATCQVVVGKAPTPSGGGGGCGGSIIAASSIISLTSLLGLTLLLKRRKQD